MEHSRAHARALALAAFLTLLACVFVLVICIGVPVTEARGAGEALAFIKIEDAWSSWGYLYVGPWGWCFEAGFAAGECSDPIVGGSFDFDKVNLSSHWESIAYEIVHSPTSGMVLHIVLAVLLVALFCVLAAQARAHSALNKGPAPSAQARRAVIFAPVLTFLIACAAFAVDLAFVVSLHDRLNRLFAQLNDDTGYHYVVSLSRAFYLMVVAFVLIMLSTLFVSFPTILTCHGRVGPAYAPPPEK